MFEFYDMTGVRLDTKYIDKFTEEQKKILDIYLSLCEAIINEEIEELRNLIPQKNIKQIIGGNISSEEWLNKIKKQMIKYYGIEILKLKLIIKDNKATIKATNKIRAKLYEYKGNWVVDSYIMLEKENNHWIINELLI